MNQAPSMIIEKNIFHNTKNLQVSGDLYEKNQLFTEALSSINSLQKNANEIRSAEKRAAFL